MSARLRGRSGEGTMSNREEMICADVRTDVVMIMAGMVLHGVTRQQHE